MKNSSAQPVAAFAATSEGWDPRVLYVCSAARCGSTLTDMFVGGHSQAASLGEINFLGKALSLNADCSCGLKLRQCPAWGVAFDAVQLSLGTDLRSNPYGLRLWDAVATNQIDRAHQTRALRAAVKWRKGIMDLREHAPRAFKSALLPRTLSQSLLNKRRLYQLLAKSWHKSVLVDSSKSIREALEFTRNWPGCIKLVLVTRDGRGVYLSRRTSGRSRQQSIEGWLNYYTRALPLATKITPHSDLLQLRYEDLASDPEGAGRRLCDHVGLRFEPEMLNLGSATRHLVNGNETRFSAARGIRLDERWRTDLSPEELAYFEKRGGEMNRRLGYF